VRKKLAVAVCAVAVAGLSAGSALAGEITGTGKSLKIGPNELHGKSECAFSGLNDEFIEGDLTAPRTQSFGQVVREVGPIGGVPGTACNPTSSSD
jgi:hypothetical protein